MAAIKIRVGASLDRSVDVVFGSIEKRAKRTGDVVAASLSKRGGRGGPYREYQREGEAAHRRVTTAAQKAAREQERAVSASLRKQGQAFKQFANIAAREQARALRADRAQSRDFARRTSHRATRFMLPNAPIGSFARRAGSDILRGAGVDTSLSGAIGRAAEADKLARDLSNAGFQRGAAGAAGVRQSPATLISEARGIADASGGTTSAGEVLQGQSAFVAKTGDLETARAVVKDLAMLSAATGANMQDVVDAAGDVSSNLGDVPNKAEKVNAIMRTIAGQGKLGAVEMKDLAVQMAKIASAAGSFEGDAGENIKKLSAMAQFARARGGAAGASQAATAVAGFANTLKTPARIKAFRKEGIDPLNERGQLRDPIKIINEAISTTGADPIRMKKMFANVFGAKGVDALTNTYRSAGGGDRGMAAVNAEWQRMLKGAALSQEEIVESVKTAQGGASAKAKAFQNELDNVAAAVSSELLPALQKLAPSAISLAKTFGDVATWTVTNPKKAIGLAITAAIARAGLESAFRSGLERMILGPNGGGVGDTGRAGRVGKVAAGLGAGLTIAATAVTVAAAGTVVID